MAKAQRTETFDVAIDKIYDVIVNYKSYPEFVDGVSSIEVLEQNEAGARVKYSLNLIKKFSYILKLKHEKPNRVSWTFESGDLFKLNNGSWDLKDNGNGTTEVTYSLEVDVKGFVPGAIVNKLTESSLPAMMKSYNKRAKEA
ncbi:polyketide cyclase/dehydrase [Bacteriovorax sp. BSW11_IV]|uniref:type II toxin-antitoxin system RatA family toxin n=1 Tax=Bacteriovorax sp. BSW11_IV TaxID=1353529 RepID=UPI00038A051C|nr:SRPBCC family protein [Bacteriovorax sp. BSW11_IV]EQC46381.1 polyketide cyclase/dehydrase [Bacteriovorax sp. BSW11_IV]